jgi:hypothetical protein
MYDSFAKVREYYEKQFAVLLAGILPSLFFWLVWRNTALS